MTDEVVKELKQLPSAQPETCVYWDRESNICALHRPSAQPDEVEAIPIEQLLSILPKYDDYIHTKTYPYNETMEDIYSEGHEEGWNACLKAIKEELDYWEKEHETN